MATNPIKYGKKVTVTNNGGTDFVFTGTRANAILNRLNDNPRYWHTTDDSGNEIYFDTESAVCGFCQIAKLEYTTEELEPIACEDFIPNCPQATAENPNPAPAEDPNPAPEEP